MYAYGICTCIGGKILIDRSHAPAEVAERPLPSFHLKLGENVHSATTAMHMPLELLDALFYHLDESPKALCACALVHRTWTDESQKHLFRGVTVSKPTTSAKLLLALEDNPALSEYVRELYVHTFGIQALPMLSGRFPTLTFLELRTHWPKANSRLQMEVKDILYFLNSFPKLETIRSSGLSFVSHDGSLLDLTRAALPTARAGS
jgi:hypothetical protein